MKGVGGWGLGRGKEWNKTGGKGKVRKEGKMFITMGYTAGSVFIVVSTVLCEIFGCKSVSIFRE